MERKKILHVDMDAFFVSVEVALNPELRGKPVIVGGDPKGRGVVSAASYKAREYGVRSAMPMAEARRLCPKALFLRGSMRIYAEFSSRIMTILERYTPAVEKMSVDEAYLDVTGCERFHRADSLTIAQRIHHSILKEVGVPASIGVASNKLIAKIAANAAKPNGIMMILPGYEASFLGPLPIDRMPGIGPVTQKAYRKMGIRVIGDLARFEPELLERVFGKLSGLMARRARGVDTRGIMCDVKTGRFGNGRGGAAAKSVSREVTYSEDTKDPQRILATLSYLSESVGKRVRDGGLCFRGVTVKLRYSDFKTYTRSRAILPSSDDSGLIFQSARELLDQLSIHRMRVRLIGVSVTTAEPVVQLNLFKSRKAAGIALVHQRMDEVRDRFGFESVLLARSCLHSSGRG